MSRTDWHHKISRVSAGLFTETLRREIVGISRPTEGRIFFTRTRINPRLCRESKRVQSVRGPRRTIQREEIELRNEN